MKKISLCLATIFAAGSVLAAGFIADTVNVGANTNGSSSVTYVQNHLYTPLQLRQIDLAGINPVSTTATAILYNVTSAGVTTQSLGTITVNSSGIGQYVAPGTATATVNAAQWIFTNSAIATNPAIAVATGTVIRSISLLSLSGTTATVSVAQSGITNTFAVTAANQNAQVLMSDIPAVNATTVSVTGLGTNICAISAAVSGFGPSSTTTSYGGPVYLLGYGDKILVQVGTNTVSATATNAAGTVKITGFSY